MIRRVQRYRRGARIGRMFAACGQSIFRTPDLLRAHELHTTTMKEPPTVPIQNCAPVLVKANADDRGCLFEIFREEWVGAFKALQWNACSSRSGVMRGVHVHIDYDEFYTLPMGRVFIALRDIRKASPTFGNSIGSNGRPLTGSPFPCPRALPTQYFSSTTPFSFGRIPDTGSESRRRRP